MSFFKVENQDGNEIEIQSPVFGYHVFGDKEMFVLSDKPRDEYGMSYSFSTYIANPGEHDWKRGLFLISMGTFGRRFLVWAQGAEDALEIAAGAASDAGMRGFFFDDAQMQKFYEEAREELGPDASEDEVIEHAETDLTYTESGYINSEEWRLDDVHQGASNWGDGEDLYMACKFVCEAYTDDSDEVRFELVPNTSAGDGWGKTKVFESGSGPYTVSFSTGSMNADDLVIYKIKRQTLKAAKTEALQQQRMRGGHVVVMKKGIEVWSAGPGEHERNSAHYDDYIISVPRMSAQRRLVYAYNADNDGWGQMIGLARGFDSEKEAFDWCQSHAFQRGKQSALVFREKHGGDVVQLGHVGEAHRGGSYQPNTDGEYRGFRIEREQATQLGYRLGEGARSRPGKGRKATVYFIYSPDDPQRPIKTAESMQAARSYIDQYLGS